MRKFEAFEETPSGINENFMLILSEEDIKHENQGVREVEIDILVLPSKYKNKGSLYLDTLRMIVRQRKGEVLYI